MKALVITIGAVLIIAMSSLGPPDKWDESSPVAQVLYATGVPIPTHYRETLDPEKVRMGKELVYEGRATKSDGSKSKFISKYFVCTDCHNQVREDPEPHFPDPDARLEYAIANDLPFLQGTTFWGITTRTSWYNGDYTFKYGEYIEKARHSLEESTQLCAKVCSSGRYLEDWELESIIQYYGSIQVTLGDLQLNEADWRRLRILAKSEKDRKELKSWIESRIMRYSPAQFIDYHEYVPQPQDFPEEEQARIGKEIYERSCLTCHRPYGPSQWILEDSRKDKRRFRKNLGKHNDFDLGHITRHGTKAEPGHMQYMPLYPKDRLSFRQLNSLIYYLCEHPG